MNDNRMKAALRSIVDDATRKVRFLRWVRARVVDVHEGSVDTEPETLGAPPLREVPIRYGLPGVLRAACRSGARAVIAWAEGDPAQPFVAAWDPGDLVSLVFGVPGGARPLARTGDSVDCGSVSFAAQERPGTPPTKALVITYTPPGVGAVSQAVTLEGLPPTLAVVGGALALLGKVTGTSVVEA